MKSISILFIVILSNINSGFGQCPKDLKIERIAGPYIVAEGPHWDEENNLLYFVDILSQKMFCYNPETKNITYAYLKCGPVGFAIPVSGKKNTFIAGCKTHLALVSWDPSADDPDPKYHFISEVDQGSEDVRFNDAKVDPRGRLWAGTMGEKNNVPLTGKGRLYRFGHDGAASKIINQVDISNGLVWSHTNDSFYYIDSFAYRIDVYRYNDYSGDITNRCTIFDFEENKLTGIPDGMTIDKAGNIWVANHSGGLVLQIDPKTGRLLQTIKMPVTLVTSVAFGGSNKDILYITSARDKLTESQLAQEPFAGSLFALYNLGVTGSSMLPYMINVK